MADHTVAPLLSDDVSLRCAAVLGLNALHECIVPKGTETQISDAMRALRSAIDYDTRQQAVLARAGTVRDQALLRLMPDVLQALRNGYLNGSLVDDLELVLKGTPAAAVLTMPCEDCAGTGATGEIIPGDYFTQPSEVEMCESCDGTGRWSVAAAPMTVIDPTQWQPCAPAWLEAHPGQCDCAPRVWNAAESNHYHPANWSAAAVADAQPVAWPEADAEDAAIGWTLDFKFVEQVREVAAMGYGFSAGQEEAEAILMAALSVHALYAAPDRQRLRKLVDRVWNEATESAAVPDTTWANRLIAEVFAAQAQPSDTCHQCNGSGELRRSLGGDPGEHEELDDCPACEGIGKQPSGNAGEVGLPVEQEPKYTTDGHSIINRASGEPIPHDEPVFIFRARDRQAIHALSSYLKHLPFGSHKSAVNARISDFLQFDIDHPDRMKEPDTAAIAASKGAKP